MSQRELTFNLAHLSPRLGELLEEHIGYYDHLLVHVFFGDVTRHALGLVKQGSAHALAELETMLGFLENRFVLGDEGEKDVITASFLENLPSPDEEGREIRYILGPGLTGQLKQIWPTDTKLA